jgi:hypothetical protein
MSGSKSSGPAGAEVKMPEPVGLTVHALPTLTPDALKRRTLSGRVKMLLVLLACAAPVVASYFTYYVIRPEGRSNYGTLVLPGVVDTPMVSTAKHASAAADVWPAALTMPPSWVVWSIFLAIRFRLAEIAVPALVGQRIERHLHDHPEILLDDREALGASDRARVPLDRTETLGQLVEVRR